MGAGSAPRCPTPFAHGPTSPTKGCSSASVTPPRWQTPLNRLSSANPSRLPGAVGLFPGNFHPPPGRGGTGRVSECQQRRRDVVLAPPHSRLAPASLHRVALEASASIADGRMRHAPVSSPRPERPRARAHLNPMFRTESPKTEVQTAIAMLQAAEEEKERARRRRRDERAAAKEAKRLAGLGGARGSAERAARSRRRDPRGTGPRGPTRSMPSTTIPRLSHSSRISSSDDDAGRRSRLRDVIDQRADGDEERRAPPRVVTATTLPHHRHRYDEARKAKRRKTEEESKPAPTFPHDDDDDASEKHHKSKHHKSGHHKSKHHKSKHHKSKHHESSAATVKIRHHHKSAANPSIIATGTSPPTPLARAIAST